jgi:hypothetical protein
VLDSWKSASSPDGAAEAWEVGNISLNGAHKNDETPGSDEHGRPVFDEIWVESSTLMSQYHSAWVSKDEKYDSMGANIEYLIESFIRADDGDNSDVDITQEWLIFSSHSDEDISTPKSCELRPEAASVCSTTENGFNKTASFPPHGPLDLRLMPTLNRGEEIKTNSGKMHTQQRRDNVTNGESDFEGQFLMDLEIETETATETVLQGGSFLVRGEDGIYFFSNDNGFLAHERQGGRLDAVSFGI